MSASRKKKKSARAAASPGKPKSPHPERGGAKHTTFVQKYYPIFENLVLFVLGMGTYWEALRAYLQEEVRYRTTLALQGFGFFLAGCTFLVGAVSFLILGLFFTLQKLTGSATLAAFLIFFVAMLLAAFFFLWAARHFSKTMETRYQDRETDTEDPGD